MFWDGVYQIVLFENGVMGDGQRYETEIEGGDGLEDEGESESEVSRFSKARAWRNLNSCLSAVKKWKKEGKQSSMSFEELNAEDFKNRSRDLREAEMALREYSIKLNQDEREVSTEKTGNDPVRDRDAQTEEEEYDSFASATTLNEPEWSFNSTAETVASEEDVPQDSVSTGKQLEMTPQMLENVNMPDIKIMKMILRINHVEKAASDTAAKEQLQNHVKQKSAEEVGSS